MNTSNFFCKILSIVFIFSGTTILLLSSCNFDPDDSSIINFKLSPSEVNVSGGSKDINLLGRVEVDSPLVDIEVTVKDSSGADIPEEWIKVIKDFDFAGKQAVDLEEKIYLKVEQIAPEGTYLVKVKVKTSSDVTSDELNFVVTGTSDVGPEITIINLALENDTAKLGGAILDIPVKGQIISNRDLASVRVLVVDSVSGNTISGITAKEIKMNAGIRSWDFKTDGNVLLSISPSTSNGTYVFRAEVAVDSLHVTRKLPITIVGGNVGVDVNILNFSMDTNAIQVLNSGTNSKKVFGVVSGSADLDTVYAEMKFSVDSLMDPSKVYASMSKFSGSSATWDLQTDGLLQVNVVEKAVLGEYTLTVIGRIGNKSTSKSLSFTVY